MTKKVFAIGSVFFQNVDTFLHRLSVSRHHFNNYDTPSGELCPYTFQG